MRFASTNPLLLRTFSALQLLAIISIQFTPTVFAADEAPVDQAKASYREGLKRYNLGEYRQALEHFKSGYRLHDDPVLLFNIAQCHRHLGETGDAIRSYRAYLRMNPEATNRADVERFISELESSPSPRAAETTPPVPSPVIPVAPTVSPSEHVLLVSKDTVPQDSDTDKSIVQQWWFWSAVGAVVVTGVIVGIVASTGGGTDVPMTTLGSAKVLR